MSEAHTNDCERIAYMNQAGCWTYLCDLQETQDEIADFDGQLEAMEKSSFAKGVTEGAGKDTIGERDDAIAERNKLAALLRSVHAKLRDDDDLKLKPARRKLAEAVRIQASYAGVYL